MLYTCEQVPQQVKKYQQVFVAGEGSWWRWVNLRHVYWTMVYSESINTVLRIVQQKVAERVMPQSASVSGSARERPPQGLWQHGMLAYTYQPTVSAW